MIKTVFSGYSKNKNVHMSIRLSIFSIVILSHIIGDNVIKFHNQVISTIDLFLIVDHEEFR
jgi:hypothetical protein